jgi:hypothetical protein
MTENDAASAGPRVVGHVFLELKDVQQALADAPGARRRFFTIGATVLFLCVVVPLTNREAAAGSFFAGVVMAGALVYMQLFQRRKVAERILAGRGERELAVDYEFSPAGLGISTAASKSVSEWSAYHHATEIPTAFLVYPNPTVFQIVPKRAFAEADLPRLRELFAAHLKGKPPTNPLVRTVVLWAVLVILFLAFWNFYASSH